MQFKDVIGQGQLKNELTELMNDNRLAHAILFLGREGVGALQLAMAFAQFIVCDKVNGKVEKSDALSLFGEPEVVEEKLNDSCGVCPSCLKAGKLIHPDIHFSYPFISKKTSSSATVSTDFITDWREFVNKMPYGNLYDWLQFIDAEKKQGNITASECADINRKLSLKSFEGGYKILLMWMPEYLGKEGNKLLKLIEEPPPNTLFLLVAENEGEILPTLLSRCQLIKVPRLTQQDIRESLISRNHTDPETASKISIICEGNYRDALNLTQHANKDWQNLLRTWLNSILKTGPLAQGKWVEEIAAAGREGQKQFLRYFIHLLQISVRLRSLPEMENQYPTQEKDFALRLNNICQIHQQEAIIDELNKAIYYIERNANASMLFMAITIKIRYIILNNLVITSS